MYSIRTISPLVTLAAALVAVFPAVAQEAKVDIPYQEIVLGNGLTLLVHEDHKAPVVAVNLWYHVGSKNEKRGKTGFAHLFEHLMFNGSENFNTDYFKVLEKLGATDLNGTTNNDRTNYFQNVPSSALDTVLWMESDRMGHLLGAIDQARLDEQRGVVQNEKRQYENEPYGLVENLITESTYPAGHPYSWTVIGSMEDLNAASLNDVREWFRTYYGPSNATIVIAGDIDAATAKAKVEKYFGSIPPGPPIAKHQVWIAKERGEHRQVLQDRVPQSRIYKVWNIPQAFSPEAHLLDLAAEVLATGKTSRLYKRLVYGDQIATDVSVYTDLREIGSQFVIVATARPGVALSKVESAIDEEMAKFLAAGPTEAELQRVKTLYMAGFLRGIERIGGFGGKSDLLAQGQVYAGDPEAYKAELKAKQSATPAQVKAAATEWLADGSFVLEILPFPEYKAAGADVDRKHVPEAATAPEPRLPDLQRATLSNGLKVILAERRETPTLEFRLLLDAGYASDQFANPGTARLAMAMLDEGTTSRTTLEISEQLDRLGARLGAGSDLDTSTVSLSALKNNLDASLALYADVILNPSFPEREFERLRNEQLAGIEREKVQPITMGLRVVPAVLYGKGHAYANPLTGSGTEASVRAIGRDALVKFHQTWFKPNNATLVVVGDTTLAELRPKLEALFSGWKQVVTPKKNVATADQAAPAVYLIDKPGAIQSFVFAGNIAPPKSNPDEIAIEALNTILGGAFVSRINMNLREDKHWSYGAGSFVFGARGQRPFLAYAPVQTDKTSDSMTEMNRELRDILRIRPVTAEEIATTKDNMTLSLPGSLETKQAVADALGELVRYGLPDDYYRTFPGKVRALDSRALATAAERLIHPDHLVWVVVGDLSKIENGVRALQFGELRRVDADGQLVK